MSQIQYNSYRKNGRRYWDIIKIVTTKKDHSCEVCGVVIPKNTKCLNQNGFSETEGYYNCYFHLDEKNGCYLDFLDAVQPNFDTRDKIVASVNRS